MKVRFAYPFVFLTVAVALLVATAFAQGYRASISGRLTDPSGSGVPNATVRAANVATNVEFRATTSDDGWYVITFLLPGTYKVTAEATGFKTAVREDVLLQVNDRRTIDFQLQVGEVKESVTVSGEAPLLTPE